jgi:hypothetical protein
MRVNQVKQAADSSPAALMRVNQVNGRLGPSIEPGVSTKTTSWTAQRRHRVA